MNEKKFKKTVISNNDCTDPCKTACDDLCSNDCNDPCKNACSKNVCDDSCNNDCDNFCNNDCSDLCKNACSNDFYKENEISKNSNLYRDEENNTYVEEELPFEEKTAKRGFFLSSLSIDETRLSILIICLLISMVFGGVNYVLVGDITTNLMQIILTLIYAIAGINITNAVVNTFGQHGEKASEMIVSAKSTAQTIRKKLRKL